MSRKRRTFAAANAPVVPGFQSRVLGGASLSVFVRCQNNVVAQSEPRVYRRGMKGLRYVYWQDGQFWLGYLDEYPDYVTQGESLQDLQEHLRDLYADLSGGHIPAVRKVAELEVA